MRRTLRAPAARHRLDRSHAFQREITKGCEGLKPGWTRVNFNYFISPATCEYLIEAVQLIADQGWKLLTDYGFDPTTGLWHHRTAPVDPPLRLSQLHYDADGTLTYPKVHLRADEGAYPEYLARARTLLDSRPSSPTWEDGEATGLPDDFEALRWFPLPAVCL